MHVTCATDGGGDDEGQGSPVDGGMEMQVQSRGRWRVRSCVEMTPTSHVTSHTSHVTRHTSHVIRHTDTEYECRRRRSAVEAAKAKPDVPGGCAAAAKGESSSACSPAQSLQHLRRSTHHWRASTYPKFIIVTIRHGIGRRKWLQCCKRGDVMRAWRYNVKRRHKAAERACVATVVVIWMRHHRATA